jgi:hypothetical protein
VPYLVGEQVNRAQTGRPTMKRPILVLALAASALVPQTSVAQECSANYCRTTNQVVANVGALMGLSLDRPADVTMNASARDITAGLQVQSGPTARVKSNTDWRLEVSAASTEWTAGQGAREGKRASDLGWRVGTNGGYTPLSTDPAQAAAGSHTSDTKVAFQYQTSYDSQSDRPGTYSLVVRYTLTTR